MGQNLPSYYNAAGLQNTGMPGNGLPANPAAVYQPPTLPGATAAQTAQVQNSLQNPNQEDDFTNALMPATPGEALAAGAMGIAIGKGFRALNKPGNENKIARMAEYIDKRLPGAQLLARQLEKNKNRYPLISDWKWFQEYSMHAYLEGPNAANEAVAAMEKRQLEMLRGNYAKKAKKLGISLDEFKQHTTFEQMAEAADKKFQDFGKEIPKDQKKIANFYANLRNRSRSLINYKNVYRDQATMLHGLKEKGVGPIGRNIASFMSYLNKIFGGETMMMGLTKNVEDAAADAGKTTLQKIGGAALKHAGPALAGVMILGSAIHKSRKAQDGEKTQTFFHDFFGFGIANFIGWEIGKKLLNSTGMVSKLLGSAQGKHLFRFIPITFAGFVTEMAAMLIVGNLFQKFIGEPIAHKIFGKPSPDSLDPDAKKQRLKQQQAQQQSMGGAAGYPQMQGNGYPQMSGYPQVVGAGASPYAQPAMAYSQAPPVSAYGTASNPYAASGAYAQPASTVPMQNTGFSQSAMAGSGASAAQSPLQRSYSQRINSMTSPSSNQPFSSMTPAQIEQMPMWQQSGEYLKQLNQTYGSVGGGQL